MSNTVNKKEEHSVSIITECSYTYSLITCSIINSIIIERVTNPPTNVRYLNPKISGHKDKISVIYSKTLIVVSNFEFSTKQ